MERWVTQSKFKGKASKRPDVYLGRVGVALGNLWRDPAWSALLSLSILLLFCQENTETHVSNFDFAIRLTKNVIRLDISMQNIVLMHRLQAKSHLIETPLAEVFSKVASPLQDNLCEIATFHQFNEHPKTVLVVENLFTVDQLFAI